jgi:hypothetical protein
MGRECRTWEVHEMQCLENLKDRYYLGDLVLDGKIIFKMYFSI